MIVAGIPAKPLRRRFSDSIAARMEELAWWDWPHAQLQASLKDFQTMPAEAFLEKYS